MPRKPRVAKRGPGRPPIPAAERSDRTIVKSFKFRPAWIRAIEDAVHRENAEMARDGNSDGKETTFSSWVLDHALEPLGLATYEGEPPGAGSSSDES